MFRDDPRDRAKSSNGRKIARLAPISKIFCRNRPRRPELNFEKKLRAVRLIVVVVCRRRCRRRRRRRGRWHGGAVKFVLGLLNTLPIGWR